MAWCKWVKLSEYYNNAKFGISYSYSVRENWKVIIIIILATYGRPNTDHYIHSFFMRVKN